MLTEKTMEKLRILAESAKYDVSCSSSGTVRKGKQGMVGSTVGGVGICHSFADDGRCISLLKVMLTNYCMYDCAYCINRRSNDIKRATLSVSELEEITMEFYRRNYIEGLFLSSGVVRNPDYTMERLAAIARDLRLVHRFNGYIHLKSIPGCSQELLNEAGRYADRMSVNIEIPKEESLKLLAPEKDHQSVFQPMKLIQQGVLENKEDRRKYRHVPRFVPAGQSTQMIVGATKETDKDILSMSSMLYGQPTMRRVYYSGYVSVNTYDPRLPVLKQPPLVRENRLYQADWLLRFYHFTVDENTADYEQLLRVPGLGTKSAWLIVNSRRFSRLTSYDLKKMGVVMKKAKYFITCHELASTYSTPIIGINELHPERLRPLLISKAQQKRAAEELQLELDFGE
jgi:putative DNA modification/repair radical SAM protein